MVNIKEICLPCYILRQIKGHRYVKQNLFKGASLAFQLHVE